MLSLPRRAETERVCCSKMLSLPRCAETAASAAPSCPQATSQCGPYRGRRVVRLHHGTDRFLEPMCCLVLALFPSGSFHCRMRFIPAKGPTYPPPYSSLPPAAHPPQNAPPTSHLTQITEAINWFVYSSVESKQPSDNSFAPSPKR
jgi:hypothetical protein